MSILITGAFGFVGSNLSAYLAARGVEVWALDVRGEVLKCESSKVRENGENDSRQSAVCNRQSAIGNRQSAAAEGEREEESVAKDVICAKGAGRGAYARCFDWGQLEEIPWGEVDAVVHLAGKAHDTKNTSDPRSYFDVNVGLTRRILQSAVGCWQSAIGNVEADKTTSIPAIQHSRNPVKKFILFSSVKAVADRVEGVLTEDVVPEPKTPYGRSKLEAEREVLKFESSKVREFGETTANDANRANEERRSEVLKCESAEVSNSGVAEVANFRTSELANFKTYVLRPCMIHGPGNKGNLNLLYGMVRKGIPWPLGGFENRRSFAAIENVCAVVERLLAGNVAPGVYQVADDEALSTNELVGLMAVVMGRRSRVCRIPAGLVRAAAKAGDVLRLPLNSERLKKLTESYVVSNAKVKSALGWETMPVGVREGMRKTLESFGKISL